MVTVDSRARLVLTVFFIVLISILFVGIIQGKLTGFSVNLRSPLIQGEPLAGAFVVDPSSIGAIPIDSLVRVDLNSISIEKPLQGFLPETYLAKNFQESQEFAPLVVATFVVTPHGDGTNPGGPVTPPRVRRYRSSSPSSNCGPTDVNCYGGGGAGVCGFEPSAKGCVSDTTGIDTTESALAVEVIYTETLAVLDEREVSVAVTRDSSGSFTLNSKETYELKEVRVYGEVASSDLVSVKQDGNKVYVSTSYTEMLPVISGSAEPFEIPLSEFGLIIPARGDVKISTTYRGQVLAFDEASFYSFPAQIRISEGEGISRLEDRQLIPGGPLSGDLIQKGCGSYVCREWDVCTVNNLKELIDVDRTLSLVQSRQCELDCGISFTQTKPCELDKKLISVVPEASQDSSDSEGSSSSGSSDSGSSSAERPQTRGVLLFDQKTAVPVARIEIQKIEEREVVNIILTQSQKALSTACYNGRLDTGESDVDCGGYCKACVKQPVDRLAVNLWMSALAALVLVFFFGRESLTNKKSASYKF